MLQTLYPALILIVALISIFSGFRKGITSQIASLLGVAFGVVAARIFTPEMVHYFKWTARWGQAPEFNDFTSNLVCAVMIYLVVFFLFNLLSGIFKVTMSVFEIGIINRLLGAFFSLLKNLLWLSICFNLFLCFSIESGLLRYEKANDGNLVGAVMDITAVFLGCYGAQDFAHFHQLKEAKSISCNYIEGSNVILNSKG